MFATSEPFGSRPILTTRFQAIARLLPDALRKQELSVQYQPQVDLRSQRIMGVEALCRWHNPELGMVSPEEFILVAEEIGYIVALGRRLLDQVALDWHDLQALSPQLRVGMNFAMRELAEPDYFTHFHSWMNQFPAKDIARLDLEITESVFGPIPDHIERSLQALRARGLRVAMDDFGVGASDFARLESLTFDCIKIDKRLIQQIDRPETLALLQKVMRFARDHQQTVIAEGVETPEQCQSVQDLGIGLVQGYLFHKPATLDHWKNHPDLFKT
jgi:EAL domain-containing protein (putative c-di-GMP-specific phosphodiesterase class I)